MSTPLFELRNLTKVYGGGLLSSRSQRALDNFSLTFAEKPAKITTIAGESGSGKSTLANLALDFIHPTEGQILYRGKDIARMSKSERFTFRREVQAIFQDPFGTYNPFYKVDAVFDTVIGKFKLAHSKAEATKQIHEALEVVGLRPNEILGKYPHQLSGGQRQRIMAARAFLLKPRIIVADEPVSMIDASLQVRILDIFRNLKETYGISFLYITHDLSTAYQISDEIYVLYSGSVMENGNVDHVIQNPQHPYTQLLVSSIPVPDPDIRWLSRSTSSAAELVAKPAGNGCKFYQRCPYGMDRCAIESPPAYQVGENQFAACYLYADGEVEPAAPGDRLAVDPH
ncbi:MAG: ABC transporter ATP-binding protein [Chloroflexi bacterium]|nr:MAG: ABC transporter ATP-binding protein [Chloroflexota bacterium]